MTQAACQHFGTCGGCASQDRPYAAQLAAKASALQELFAAHWAAEIAVTPSPRIWHYRNKIDPAFARMRYPEPPPKEFVRETVLGYKRRGRWYDPFELHECRIAPEGTEALLEGLRRWREKTGLRAWDARSDDGLLRHLVLRDGKRTGQRMAVLITSPTERNMDDFVEAVQAHWPAQSIYHGMTRRRSDVAIAEELRLLHGTAQITEDLQPDLANAQRPLRFRISPFSFFQTNPLAAEQLYARLRDWLKLLRPDFLCDLYGGVGSIALSCADLAAEVVSVEEVAEAGRDGAVNAAENGVGNVRFLTEKTELYLRGLREGAGMPYDSAVVVDPPRAGMHPKALKYLMELHPPHVAYVACNPKLLARDCAMITEGYRLTGLEAFDFFPHTPHVEAVAFFEAR